MKLQIDTTNKTIKVEGDVVISELISTLEKLFPKKEWEKFLLKTETQIRNWDTPIVYRDTAPYWQYPWYFTTCGHSASLTATDTREMQDGVFNVVA